MSEEQPPPPREQRDTRGRFVPGWAGGPGRPRRETERAYLDAAISACTVEEWRLIVRRAVEEALGGDRFAREWLRPILMGNGNDNTDHETGQGVIIRVAQKEASMTVMPTGAVRDDGA